MKKLFSKKSGFTLVEIVIALAVFAIMASMIAQMLNLAVRRRRSNLDFEKNLQNQEETLITNPKSEEYEKDKDKDGTLKLDFKDQDGKKMPMDLDYQLRSADGTLSDKSGVNYFKGKLSYDGTNGQVEYIPDKPGENPTDPSDTGGSSQMSRFDTRITGTKGISSVMVSYTYSEADDEYTFTVTVTDSGVSSAIKSHSQVTLFFGEGKAGAPLLEVAEVNGGTKNTDDLKYAKICGVNGVNIHCKNDNGFGGSSGAVSFKVKFKTKLEDPNSIAFGVNASGAGTSQTYTMYKDDKGKEYPNIYGAYAKPTTPENPADPADLATPTT